MHMHVSIICTACTPVIVLMSAGIHYTVLLLLSINNIEDKGV